MENKYKLWVARDSDGELYLYNEKPECYNEYFNYSKVWFTDGVYFELDNKLFPDITCKNEPIEVELRPAITDIDAKAEEYANSVTDNEELREMIVNAFKAGYNA